MIKMAADVSSNQQSIKNQKPSDIPVVDGMYFWILSPSCT